MCLTISHPACITPLLKWGLERGFPCSGSFSGQPWSVPDMVVKLWVSLHSTSLCPCELGSCAFLSLSSLGVPCCWGSLSSSESCLVVSDSLWPHGLYSPWNSPDQNTEVDSLSLLHVIFPTQGLNPGLLHCRRILYQLSHKGSPRILEWVAYPFSSGSSQPRNQTGVSFIAGGFFVFNFYL